MQGTVQHIPVLLQETLELLKVHPGGTYVDGTVGRGGHSGAILRELGGSGLLVAVDRDLDAIEYCRKTLGSHPNFRLCHENYKNLPLLLNRLQIPTVDGCLLDLGVSSPQLNEAERGFSFLQDGPLDMRMDRRGQTTAADLVNSLSKDELVRIFREFGEEPQARRIADAICRERLHSPLRTTGALAELVEKVKGRFRGKRIHPATQVFQALRIEVNQELQGLEELLAALVERLGAAGRLCVISFHSLEDRIVKRTFRKLAGRCVCFRPGELCSCPREKRVELITKKPVRASQQEISTNPRSRSARLRAVERRPTP